MLVCYFFFASVMDFFVEDFLADFLTTKIGVLDLFISWWLVWSNFQLSPTSFERKHFCCDFNSKTILTSPGKSLKYQY